MYEIKEERSQISLQSYILCEQNKKKVAYTMATRWVRRWSTCCLRISAASPLVAHKRCPGRRLVAA